MSMKLNNGALVPAFGGTAAITTADGDTGYEGYTHWVCDSDVSVTYMENDEARTVLAGSVRAFTGKYKFTGINTIEVM